MVPGSLLSLQSHTTGVKDYTATVSLHNQRCIYDLSTLQRTPTCEDQTEHGVRHHGVPPPAPQLLLI